MRIIWITATVVNFLSVIGILFGWDPPLQLVAMTAFTSLTLIAGDKARRRRRRIDD